MIVLTSRSEVNTPVWKRISLIDMRTKEGKKIALPQNAEFRAKRNTASLQHEFVCERSSPTLPHTGQFLYRLTSVRGDFCCEYIIPFISKQLCFHGSNLYQYNQTDISHANLRFIICRKQTIFKAGKPSKQRLAFLSLKRLAFFAGKQA